MGKKPYLVFISHASSDTWVARQLSQVFKKAGASTFLDFEKLEAGVEFNSEIISNLNKSKELVVLLTPWALDKPYIWIEIGGALIKKLRVVALLHGLTQNQFLKSKKNVAALTSKHLLTLNEVDSYISQLKKRIRK